MNINTLTNYVNLDVDDTFTVQEITMWFNKGIANYNLIPPLTTYPLVSYGVNEQDEYPLEDMFMLGIMLPFITSSVRGSESSLSERQLFLQEYMQNAYSYKHSVDTPTGYLKNQKNTDLSEYEMGEGVYMSNFENSPFAGRWDEPANIGEIVVEEE